jgi:hypothetical protein
MRLYSAKLTPAPTGFVSLLRCLQATPASVLTMRIISDIP